MNKTVASLTLLVASLSAQAMPRPIPGGVKPPVARTYCLSVYEAADGSQSLGTCDQSDKNQRSRAALNENKCAEGQASFTSSSIVIKACPSYMQL